MIDIFLYWGDHGSEKSGAIKGSWSLYLYVAALISERRMHESTVDGVP